MNFSIHQPLFSLYLLYNLGVENIILQLKNKNPDLKQSEIEGLLYILSDKKEVSNNDLITITGLPKPVLQKFKSTISGYLEDTKTDKIILRSDIQKYLTELNLTSYNWCICNEELSSEDKKILDKISLLRTSYNKLAKRDYDQFYATPKSSLKKAKIVADKGLIKNNKIALLGDDDFVSVALGLMDSTFASIDVFEIDSDLIDFLTKSVDELKIKNINYYNYDARNDLPSQFINKYSVVMTDPPYTRYGVDLFLHRSLELLKTISDYSGNYIFLNFGSGLRNPEKEIKIQDVVNQYNLLIEDKINKFTTYTGAETIGNSSSIYVLKSTPATIVNDLSLNTRIYTFEIDAEEKFPYVDHLVIKIKDVKKEIITSKTALQKLFGQFCYQHKLKVVDTKITRFSNQGFSLTYILSNSNLVVHTWPEHRSLHIDLITCSPIFNKNKILYNLSKLFTTNKIEARIIE